MTLLQGIKNKINSWIKSLAKENEQEYGNKELSCCGLNEKKKGDKNV